MLAGNVIFDVCRILYGIYFMSLREIANDPAVKIVGIAIVVVFVLGVMVEFILSKWLKRNYISSEYLIINLSVAFLQQLTDLLNKGIFLFAFVFVQSNYSIHDLMGWQKLEAVNPFSPFNPGMLLLYFLVIAVADFCQYWLHRLSHEVNIMWAGHVTHHSNSEYNLSVAVRQNALEGIYTWVFFIPLAFLGVPWQMFVLAYSISLVWQFLVHTQFIGKLGFLESFMSTPSHHRVHHGKNERYIDKNYGAFFIVWDKLFGTFEPETEQVAYGITQPLTNENPVWSNVHHHADIISRTWEAQTVKEKVKWVFGRPSVIYGKEEAERVAVAFTPQREKILYVFLNFLLTAVAGFFLLSKVEETGSITLYAGAAAFILTSFTIYAGLLQNQKWADYAEIMRLALIAVAGIIMLLVYNRNEGLIVVFVVLGLLLFTKVIADNYKRSYS